MRDILRQVGRTGAACLALLLLVLGLGALTRPEVGRPPPARTPEEIATAARERDLAFDPDPARLPRLQVPVDYADAPNAPWYPRGEAPVLADLVRAGKLPPVAERVGPEPVVLRGADGIGRYGGTWLRVANEPGDVGVIGWRLSYASPMRWSPLGYPMVPHVLRALSHSPDKREWTLTLRRGMRWSDGAPFSADDILYWWEQEVNDPVFNGFAPDWMKTGGQVGQVQAMDPLTVRIVFAQPHGLFAERLCHAAHGMVNSPAHYLRPLHPRLGDEARCQALMTHYKLPSRLALYGFVKQYNNPEHPRLWPWVYRTYRPNPPQVFVRNPYYCAVDEQGNQLPYLDRIQFEVQDLRMLTLSALNGKIGMQARNIRYEDYTELMDRREASGIRVLQWYPATRAVWVINPNLNRRWDPDDTAGRWKAQLLGDARFRQALSLAIDRATIIRAEYNDQVAPAQVSPGPESPFHHPAQMRAFTAYDPAGAAARLDALGLTGRDAEGLRTFPDGGRMTFYLDYCAFTGPGPIQFVVDDWRRAGVRAVARERSRPLFYTDKDGMNFDFNVWSGESDYMPLCYPRYFVPYGGESFYAVGWGRWYERGGLYDSPESRRGACRAPPAGHPILEAMRLHDEALRQPAFEEQKRRMDRILDLTAENLWTIGIAVAPPQLVVVKDDFMNVPERAMYSAVHFTPGNAGIELFALRAPADSPGAVAETRAAIERVTPRPGVTPTTPAVVAARGDRLGRVLRGIAGAIALLALGLVALRHPYIGRRLLIMLPTLLVITVVVFGLIQLPPGDYLSARILQLEESGETQDLRAIEDLKAIFHFDEPVYRRYLRWMGFHWFATRDPRDAGLLQGNMGRSMETSEEVNKIVGDRIVLTVALSLGTILLTWALAIPIGIYSAVRQYSAADYVLTVLGFIGMCVPSFLLALVLMALTGVTGLFSAAYATAPEWSWGKLADLLKHIWIPIVVLGLGGTAGMIRVMRANLLDELRKPYVVTARAKGVRPLRLLFRYPVRIALNPFISGIGHLFPQLVSGGAIVSMVLALPTVGPLLLGALFSQDMYLAGSMLMVLSMLGVLGTLVSDLLLLWLDPRIRYQGGAR